VQPLLDAREPAEGYSQREIADVLGVDVATVNRDVHVADATPERQPPTHGDTFHVADATPVAHVSHNSGDNFLLRRAGS